MTHYLSFLLTLPVAGALVLVLMPRALTLWARWIANLTSLAVVCVTLPLWWAVTPPASGFQLTERLPWMPSIGVEYSLGVDGFSALLMLLTAIVGAAATIASWSADVPAARRFYASLLVLQAGLLGAFAARDSLLFFLCWQIALAASYVLIRGWQGGEAPQSSATRFLVLAAFGSAATLAAIVMIHRAGMSAAGIRTFDMAALQTLNLPFNVQLWTFLLLFVGFMAVVPSFPLGRWMTRAELPIAVPLLLTAVVVKVGFYGFIRIALPVLPDAARSLSPFLAALAAAGILYGAGMAWRQREGAAILAYASLSQLATALLGMLMLNSVALIGSMALILTHVLSVGGILLLGGMADRGRPGRTEDDGASRAAAPLRSAQQRLLALAAIGVPALSGFVAIFLILQGALSANAGWAAVAAGGALLVSASMSRLYREASLTGSIGDGDAGRRDLSVGELALLTPVIVATVGLGLYPSPLLERLSSPVRQVVARVSPEQPATAAECDTTVTPAMKAANPAAQFLEAAPCGPDGEPLPISVGSRP